VLFQKELAFGRDAIVRQTQVIAEFIVAVWLAFRLGNVWAIVYGMLAGRVVGLLVSYAIQPYRPRLIFEIQKAKALFDFGRYVWGYTVIIFLITQGDDALVGRVLGTAALGFYSLAYKISNFPATGITHVISRVTFPAYSKLQDNLLTLRRGYLEVLQLTAFISLPVAGGVFSLAPEITRILLGEKWMLLVPAMQILALAGAARSVSATTGPVFQALGRPEVLTKLVAGRLAILALVIYPLTSYFGIVGSGLAVFLSALAIDPISFHMAMKLTEGDLAALGKSMIVPFASTTVMVLAIFAAKTRLIGQSQIGELFLAAALGAMVYLIVSYILDRTFSTGLMSNMRARLASL
jgi:lipopolysaccharide exporter